MSVDEREKELLQGVWTHDELIAELKPSDAMLAMIPKFDLFIMAPCRRDASADFFRRQLKEKVLADSTVIMVFADCCGTYDDGAQTMIRRAFPRQSWWFPLIILDYCECAKVGLVLEDLLQARAMSRPLPPLET